MAVGEGRGKCEGGDEERCRWVVTTKIAPSYCAMEIRRRTRVGRGEKSEWPFSVETWRERGEQCEKHWTLRLAVCCSPKTRPGFCWCECESLIWSEFCGDWASSPHRCLVLPHSEADEASSALLSSEPFLRLHSLVTHHRRLPDSGHH